VKPEKQEQYSQLIRKLDEYRKSNSELFKEVKSWKLFVQTFGEGTCGEYIEIREYDNSMEQTKSDTKFGKDKVFLKLYEELKLVTDPVSFKGRIWHSVK
jgi:hypothetical protein